MANRKDSKGRVLRNGESERKDGRYSYRYIGSDGRRKEIYGSDLNELRNKAKEVARNLVLGICDNNVTLNECFDRYMLTKTNLRKTSQELYSSNYNRWIRDTWLGRKKVKDIKRSDVLLFYKEKGESLSGSTVQSIASLLYSVLDMAFQDDLVLKNPASGCFKAIPKSKPREAISDSEMKKFLYHAEQVGFGKDFLLLTKFLLGTGLRIGEATGLVWDDIDFSNETVSVNKQMIYLSGKRGNGFSISPTKTESGNRIVPLSRELTQLLREHKNSSYFKSINCGVEIDGYKGFVFCTSKGLPYTIAGVNSYFKRVSDNYKKTYDDSLPHLSCHLLRHTFCTNMANRGMNPKALQYIMGHSDYSITANVYITEDCTHAKEDFLRVMGQ